MHTNIILFPRDGSEDIFSSKMSGTFCFVDDIKRCLFLLCRTRNARGAIVHSTQAEAANMQVNKNNQEWEAVQKRWMYNNCHSPHFPIVPLIK